MIVRRVPPEVTYALRRDVLRPHQTLEQMRLAGDDDPRSGAFAAYDGEAVVGVATVRPEACPWRPEVAAAWRLRGMATVPSRRGTGVGAAVLAAAVEHVRAEGGALVWCHARTPALGFYERAGFRAYGEPWEDPDIGPHVHMALGL